MGNLQVGSCDIQQIRFFFSARYSYNCTIVLYWCILGQVIKYESPDVSLPPIHAVTKSRETWNPTKWPIWIENEVTKTRRRQKNGRPCLLDRNWNRGHLALGEPTFLLLPNVHLTWIPRPKWLSTAVTASSLEQRTTQKAAKYRSLAYWWWCGVSRQWRLVCASKLVNSGNLFKENRVGYTTNLAGNCRDTVGRQRRFPTPPSRRTDSRATLSWRCNAVEGEPTTVRRGIRPTHREWERLVEKQQERLASKERREGPVASRASQSHGRACSTGTSCYRDRCDSTWKSTLRRASYNRQSILLARLFRRSFKLFVTDDRSRRGATRIECTT